jgi:hypothetical protein
MTETRESKRDVAAKILAKKGLSGIVETLSERLSLSELQSVLLDIYRKKLSLLGPGDVMRDYRQNRFVRRSAVPPRHFLRFDRAAHDLLPEDFECLELPPLAPLGTCSLLAPVHQNNVVTTLRHCEVLADTTNYLALESAVRRKEILSSRSGSNTEIKLAASQRVVRGQHFEYEGYTAHFKIFSLVTAGRGEANQGFERRSLKEHVSFYFALMDGILDDSAIRTVTLKVFDLEGRDNTVFHELCEDLVHSRENTSLKIETDSSFGQNYYKGLRFMINITNREGLSLDYIDGGFTDWTQQLLSDGRERLLTSGAGSELLIKKIGLKG